MTTTPAGGRFRPPVDKVLINESIGALLTRLRLARGFSQLRVAERLCAAAGVPTVSRHEVSRWEREERVPGPFWLSWLAVVLDTPLEELEAAVAAARPATPARPRPGPAPVDRRLWRPPTGAELLTILDRAGTDDLCELAHVWLAGPPDPPAATSLTQSITADPAAGLATRLAQLRRMDDLIGGVDLAHLVDDELRAAIGQLPVTGRPHRRRLLRQVAGLGQLAGWVYDDAGLPAAARRSYRLALRAAAAAGDRPLAAYVLSALSHHTLAAGDPHQALLLARTAQAGAAAGACALTRALLLHRIALAAARAGERRTAHAALAAADQAADQADPDRESPWLYWLDQPELAAMTGRCLVVLGRPLRAARLLATPRQPAGPRTAAIYGGWLARAYLQLGEVEQACRVAMRAWRDTVRTGSTRAATGLRHLHPLLLRHRDLPAVRGYERLAAAASCYLPAPASIGSRHRVPTGPHLTVRTAHRPADQ